MDLSSEEFRFEFDQTLDDLRAQARWISPKSPRHRLKSLFVLCLFLVLVGASLLPVGWHIALVAVGLCCGVLIIFQVAPRSWLTRIRASTFERLFARSENAQIMLGHRTAVISPQMIEINSEYSRREFPWQAIGIIRTTNDGLIFTDAIDVRKVILFLPKRSFTDSFHISAVENKSEKYKNKVDSTGSCNASVFFRDPNLRLSEPIISKQKLNQGIAGMVVRKIGLTAIILATIIGGMFLALVCLGVYIIIALHAMIDSSRSSMSPTTQPTYNTSKLPSTSTP
jgi:hypothetical protein